jgi:hypothetical protein
MDFPHFEGTRARIWLDKCVAYFTLYQISHFEGTDARIWLDKCLAYFTLYQIPPNFRVSPASIHMFGGCSSLISDI